MSPSTHSTSGASAASTGSISPRPNAPYSSWICSRLDTWGTLGLAAAPQPHRHSSSSEHSSERRAPTAAARPGQRSAHGPGVDLHAQYDRAAAGPVDGQIERFRRVREVVDLAHGNSDLAVAEPLGHAREPATVRLH